MRPLVVLLVAALLTAMAMASAIAMGSGLWRLPLIDTPAVLEVQLHYYPLEERGEPAPVPDVTRIEARLPAGWVPTDSGMTNDPIDPEHGLSVSFWAVAAVFFDPCNTGSDQDLAEVYAAAEAVDPPRMWSLDGLALAFTGWWPGDPPHDTGSIVPHGPTTTQPSSTMVSSLRAQYLELRVPDDVDLRQCVGGRYVTWMNAEALERRHQPGDVSRMWIVEVGPPPSRWAGLPDPSTPLLVIDATSRGEPSAEAVAELAQIIDSLRIEAPEPWPPSR